MNLSETITAIRNAMRGTRFNFTTETELQEGVAMLLAAKSIAFQREVILDAENRIDFFFPAGVGLETKINGSLSEIARQVQRYMERPEIDALILLSRRSNVHDLPGEINGKPLHIITLWSNGL